MFTEKDLQQIKEKGQTQEIIQNQIEKFKKGFPNIVLYAPATPGNGLNSYSEEEAISLAKYFDDNYEDYDILKFVPASGAASRMFKHLFEFNQTWDKSTPEIEKYENDKSFNSVYNFFNNIFKFAFYDHLKELMLNNGLDLDECISNHDFKSVLEYFITDKGLNYSSLPKGLLLFHDYADGARLSVEEHMVECAHYSTDKDTISRMHLTVSPEHQNKFENAIENKKDKFEKRYDVKFDIHFSQQKPETDIIAVTPNNDPARDDKGDLIFRPGGHGALIENLNELDSEIVFIKNIDNIVPDRLRDQTYLYKKVIGGLLFKLQALTFEYLDILDGGDLTDDELNEIMLFAQNELNIFIPDAYEGYETIDKIDFLFNKLNRPIRICGMVKNEGEPGGGPFWVIDDDDNLSLQIVESSQMDLDNNDQKEIISKATHFNPVDLVCGIRNYKGEKFNLKEFIDPNTGFISLKSLGSKSIKAQELPGLWNGAMADWITIFVETPIITFNPVKTINDLLRPQHQPKD
jgi:hypothetical protein